MTKIIHQIAASISATLWRETATDGRLANANSGKILAKSSQEVDQAGLETYKQLIEDA